MFATLRKNDENNLVARDGVHPIPRQACTSCRASKLKCSGEHDGCHRCRIRSIDCKYDSRASRRTSRLKNRKTHKSPTATSDLDTNSSEILESTPDDQDMRKLDAVQVEDLAVSASQPGDPAMEMSNDFLDELIRESFDPISLAQLQPNINRQDFKPLIDRNAKESSRQDNLHCLCVSIAMKLIESLDIEILRTALNRVDDTLRLTRNVLFRCREMQKCDLCKNDSSQGMLIIVLCQKLNATFQQLFVILGNEYNRIHANDDYPLAEIPNGTPPTTIRQQVESSVRDTDVLVQSYEVDEAERPCVFSGIVVTQLWSMKSFVRNQRLQFKLNDWQNHIILLDIVERLIDEQLRMARKA